MYMPERKSANYLPSLDTPLADFVIKVVLQLVMMNRSAGQCVRFWNKQNQNFFYVEVATAYNCFKI